MKVTLFRKNDAFKLEAKNDSDNSITFDNTAAGGGNDGGFRPMQTLLAAAGACSSFDVISILKKQRIEQFEMTVTVEGERESGKDANLWKKVHLHFELKGAVPKEKAQRAVELSVTKYCSVSKTLEAAGAVVTSSVEVKD
ncbi:MAG: OsmC family protein [Bacteroidota bacterium]